MSDKPSYIVRWTYSDTFGNTRREKSPHHTTLEDAQSFAAETFANEKPDAWWIEAVTTVEYHDKTTDAPALKYGVRRRDGSVREFPSKTAVKTFVRDLPPLALQYHKEAIVSFDGGKSWSIL